MRSAPHDDDYRPDSTEKARKRDKPPTGASRRSALVEQRLPLIWRGRILAAEVHLLLEPFVELLVAPAP